MDSSDRSIISSLDNDTTEETWQSLLSSVQSWRRENGANRHYTLLQKLNSIYKQLTDVTHTDKVILTCCQALSTGWTALNSKYLLNTAKVLSHLSVKVLDKGSHCTCMGCCELLTLIVPELEGLDDKERLAITGYCYKSIWNKHGTSSSTSHLTVATVYKERVMALRLAAVSGWEKQVSKYAQQITVTVSACSTTGEGRSLLREGLSQLKSSVDTLANRSKGQEALWWHLSLFIGCLQSLYSVDYVTDIQIESNVAAHAQLCQAILERYRQMVSREEVTKLPLASMDGVLEGANNPVQLQSISLLLNAASKLINADAYRSCSLRVLLSWVDIILADIHTNRKLYKLEEEARRKHFMSREITSYHKLLQLTVEVVARTDADQETMLSLLESNVYVIKSLIGRGPDCEPKPFTDMASNISRILYQLVSKEEGNGETIQAAKRIAFSAIEVLDSVRCVDSMMLVRSHLCDLLVRQYAFVDALDSFKLFSAVPSSHWTSLVTEWCKIKKKATTAAVPTVSSRVIGVEVFGGLANRDDLIWLVVKEFTEFSIKECYYPQLKVLIAVLKSKSVTKVHKALYCLCQVELLVTLDKDIPGAQRYIEKGLELLNDNISIYCNDLTAQFLTWRYVIGYRDCCCMLKVNDALSITNYEAATNTVKSQNATQQTLDEAVMLWTQTTSSSLYSEAKTAQCLDTICNTFYLSRNLNKTLAACAVAADLLPAASLPQSIRLLRIETLTLLGDIKQATEILSNISDPDSDDLLLQRAVLYIHAGDKVGEAVDILEGIVERQNKRSLEEVYTLATAHRLLLDLILNNPTVQTRLNLSQHSWSCQKEHSTLLNSMTAYRLKAYGLKLQYLDAVLSSYITMAKVNLYVGSVRECLCFLQTSLNMARLLLLPLREADISTTQARLALFLDDLVEAQVYLRRAHSSLTSQITVIQAKEGLHVLSTPKAATDTDNTKCISQRLSSIKQSNIFGFESDEDAANESFTIKEPAISDEEDVEYKVPSYTKDSRDFTASPTFNKQGNFGDGYTDWGPYQHPDSCRCDICSDHTLQLSHLRVLAALCVYRIKSGLTQEAVDLSREAVICSRAVEKKSSVLGQRYSAELIACQLQLLTCTMKGLAALNNYKEMSQEWMNVECLNTTSYHSLAVRQLTYLHYIPHVIQYCQVHFKKLDMKAESAVKSIDSISSPLQPININRTAGRPFSHPTLLDAPRKTRQVALSKAVQLAFDDSDTEENQVLSSKRSGRATKSVTKSAAKSKTQRLGSLTRAQSPLAAGPTRLRSAKKAPITVFCDDEQLEERKSARSRRNTESDSVDSIKSVRSSRRVRTSNREVMRSLSVSDADDYKLHQVHQECSPVPEFVSPEPKSPVNVPPFPAELASDDSPEGSIELLRGDKMSAKSKNRKYSAAESMRSSAPSQYSSSPELLTSPTQELISPLSTQCAAERQTLVANMTSIWKDICSKPPYLLYRSVCQSLAILHYKQSDWWLSAFYLMETHAITFSHKSNLVRAQKLHQRKKECNTETHKPILELPSSRTIQDFKSAVNALPTGFVTCSISVVTVPETSQQQLYLTRLERNQEPVVLLATDMPQPQEIWKEFEEILEASKDSMRETRKNVWWEKRRRVDDRLKMLLARMQRELGVARTALLGCYSDRKSRQVVERCTERVTQELSAFENVVRSRSLIRMLVNGADNVTEDELNQYFLQQHPSLSKDLRLKLANLVMEGVRVCVDIRDVLVVCLDKGAHCLCWESMPYLWELAITRMPSLYTIQSYMRSLTERDTVYTAGIDTSNAFYVLNPDDNLPSTESLFKPLLTSKKNWQGIVGRRPTAEEYTEGLTDHDLFIFLGHGSGSKYLRPRELCKINCTAAVLLMGCSSGAFDSRGEMESAGIICDYHIANCPSVMACLWDVTDKDIDRFTNSIINKLLAVEGDDSPRVLDCIPAARRACKLPYLVGCASVVYGLPVSLKTNK